MEITLPSILGFIALIGTGITAWVMMRERIVRAETKIESLESQHRDHKNDFGALREWLETQFQILRHDIARKADRDK